MSQLSVVKPGQHSLSELEEIVLQITKLQGSNGNTVTMELLQKRTGRTQADLHYTIESLRKKGLLRVALPSGKPRWAKTWRKDSGVSP